MTNIRKTQNLFSFLIIFFLIATPSLSFSKGLRHAVTSKIKTGIKGGLTTAVRLCTEALTSELHRNRENQNNSGAEVIFQDGGFRFEVIRGGASLEIHATYFNKVSKDQEKDTIQLPGNALYPDYESFLTLNSLLGGRFMIPTADLDTHGNITQVYLTVVDRKLENTTVITPDSGSEIKRIQTPGNNNHILIQVGNSHLVDFIHYDRLPGGLKFLKDDWSHYSKRIMAVVNIDQFIPYGDNDQNLIFSNFDFSQWRATDVPVIKATLRPEGTVDSRFEESVFFFAAPVGPSIDKRKISGMRALEGKTAHSVFVMAASKSYDSYIKVQNSSQEIAREIGLDEHRFISLGTNHYNPTAGKSLLTMNVKHRTAADPNTIVLNVNLVTPGAPLSSLSFTTKTIVTDCTPDLEDIEAGSLNPSLRFVHIPMKERDSGETRYVLTILFKIGPFQEMPHIDHKNQKKSSSLAVLPGVHDAPAFKAAKVVDMKLSHVSEIFREAWDSVVRTYQFVTYMKKTSGEIEIIENEAEPQGDGKPDERTGSYQAVKHTLFSFHTGKHRPEQLADGRAENDEFKTALIAHPDLQGITPKYYDDVGLPASERPLILELDFGPARGQWYAVTDRILPDHLTLFPANQKTLVLGFKSGKVSPYEGLHPTAWSDSLTEFEQGHLQVSIYEDPEDPTRMGWTFGGLGRNIGLYHSQEALRSDDAGIVSGFLKGPPYTQVIQAAYDPTLFGIDRKTMQFQGFQDNLSFYWTGEQKLAGGFPLRRILTAPGEYGIADGVDTYDLYEVQMAPQNRAGYLVTAATDIRHKSHSQKQGFNAGRFQGEKAKTDDSAPVNEEYKPKTDSSHSKILVIPPADAKERGLYSKPILIPFEGQVKEVDVAIEEKGEKQSVKVVVVGTLPTIGGSVPAIASYRLTVSGAQKEYELVNLDENPVYQNPDNGITLYRTNPTPSRPPGLWLKQEGIFAYRQLKLNFQFAGEEAEKFRKLLQWLYGLRLEPKEFEAIWQSWGKENPLPLKPESVELIGDDIVSIQTEPARGIAERTYFYSLRQKKTLFFLPRYRNRYSVGDFQFFVGEADQTMSIPGYVVVLDKNNKFVTHFDLGNLDLSFNSADAIQQNGDQIIFNLKSGEVRIFDVKKGHFLGWVEPDIEEKLADLRLVGEVINQSVVRTKGRDIVGRNEEIKRLEQLMPFSVSRDSTAGKQRNTALLVGPKKSGKFSAVEEWIRRYVNGQWEEEVDFKPVFFQLIPGEATADSTYRGQLAGKYRKIKETASAIAQKGYRLVLILEDADVFIRRHKETSRHFGQGNESEFAGLLRLLGAQNIDIVATTTQEGWSYIRAHAPDMAEAFNQARIVSFDSMSRARTLETLREYYQDDDNLSELLADDGLEKVTQEVHGINSGSASPGTEFALLDALSERIGKQKENGEGSESQAESIVHALSNVTSYPRDVVRARLDYRHIQTLVERCKKQMQDNLVGQEHVVEKMMSLLRRILNGSAEPKRPLGMYLFAGPTGVGKTEIVQQFAQCLDISLRSEQFLVINGSEYVTSHPDLTIKLQRDIAGRLESNPFTIILLDEFEKIHPDYRQIILPLGNGSTTSPTNGTQVSTENAILFATSNIGSLEASKNTIGLTGGSKAGDRTVYMKAISEQLPPEQIGRFDILVFDTLTEEQMMTITGNLMNYSPDRPTNLAGRYAQVMGGRVQIRFSEDLIRDIARKAIKDVQYGARSNQRTLRNTLQEEIDRLYPEIRDQLAAAATDGDQPDAPAIELFIYRDSEDGPLLYRLEGADLPEPVTE